MTIVGDGKVQSPNIKPALYLVLISIIAVVVINSYLFSFTLGLGKLEAPPLLYSKDQTPYVEHLVNYEYYGFSQITQYDNSGKITMEALLPTILFSKIYNLIGIKWFYLAYLLIVPSMIFLVVYKILRISKINRGPAGLSTYYLLITVHVLFACFASRTFPSIRDSFWKIRHSLFGLINPLLTPVVPDMSIIRYMSPGIPLLIILVGVFLILKLQREYDVKKDILLSVCNIGCFFTHIFAWQVFYCLQLAHVITMYQRKKLKSISIYLLIIVTLISIGVLVHTVGNINQDFLDRAGILYSRKPSFDYSFNIIFLMGLILLVGIVKNMRYVVNEYFFILVSCCGFLLVVNQNMITGMEFVLLHVAHFVCFITSIFTLLVLIKEVRNKYFKLAGKTVAIVFCLVASFRIISLNYFYSTDPDSIVIQNKIEQTYGQVKLIAKDFIEDFHRSKNIKESFFIIGDKKSDGAFHRGGVGYIDLPLAALTPKFSFVPFASRSAEIDVKDFTDMLLAILLIGEELEISDSRMASIYDYYSQKCYTYYFKGPPARMDIKPRPPKKQWKADEIEYVLNRLKNIEEKDLDNIIKRGKLSYIICDDELDYGNSTLINFKKSYGMYNLYTFNIENAAKRIHRHLPRLRNRLEKKLSKVSS